jgi:Rrf2 family transcriptional regulator, nitric oxide-sensitive transcriptional repressor
MKLTSFTDYSLRVLIYVAAQSAASARIADIARTYDISEHHLTKVVQSLGKAGFLTNVRGHGGGLELARPAREIKVGAVVRHTEGAAMPAACFDPTAIDCKILRVCRLRLVFEEALRAFYAVLDDYTLEDLVRNRQVLHRVLFPAASPA